MTGEGQQINIPCLDINREVAGGLGSINKDKDVFVLGTDDFDGLLDVLDRTEDIGCVGEGKQNGVVGAGIDECLEIDEALGIAGDDGYVNEIVRCVAVEGTEYGIVFNRGSDHMGPGLRTAGLHGAAEHAVD